MTVNDIRTIPTWFLLAMRDLCPDGKDVKAVTFSAGGQSVTLTKETRARADAELKRRKKAGES